MVMRNAATGRSETDLPALYDELEGKIRSLKSLGWTQDKYGEFLSPLVESFLPEDILLTFERSKIFKENTPGDGRTLNLLMNFLKQEVKNDEMVELARNNFSAPVNQKKKEVNKPDKFPSAARLARVTGHSLLNDLLCKGPNVIEQIPDILDRFRRYPIGLFADIEKAFLQLGITPKHRDFLRFFYSDKGEDIVYCHCRVVFGVSPSPGGFNAPGRMWPVSTYTGVNDIAQQEEFILRSKEIVSRGCYDLCNWESNVETTVQKIFDSIGMLCSVTLTPKLLLQNTCKLKLSWDSSLPEEIVKLFFKWWNEIKILSDVETPRYFEINDTTKMHVFVDAYKEAYANCIFFRSKTSQSVKVALVRAKARVAPLKQVTILRLVAWVLRFLNNVRSRISDRKKGK
ncbi:uncharacterized protein TNCV_2143232 [Trichonephila clavipes]|nr:uncharacterized protein TNCV_2143232 [Trichonephila clavipes]